jgi:hypothetical protein
LPREDRDLFIAANNGHVLAFDNVSGLPGWISDTLCRLATGGGFAVRQLYTDQDEVLFDAARPMILNGIEEIVSRPDRADRAIFLTLDPIPEGKRRLERELWAAFEHERPQILGVLLDAIAYGLRMLPRTRLERLPRMADFALWATACEEAFWPSGTFLTAYAGNREDAVDSVIEADPVGSGVHSLMAARTEWTGTASDLLGALGEMVGDAVRKTKSWPATPRTLANRLRRVATFLRKKGIDIEYTREGRTRTRTITISAAAENAELRPSAPSAAPARAAVPSEPEDVDDGIVDRMGDDADVNVASADDAAASTVRTNPAKTKAADDTDGADAKIPPDSVGWRARL